MLRTHIKETISHSTWNAKDAKKINQSLVKEKKCSHDKLQFQITTENNATDE